MIHHYNSVLRKRWTGACLSLLVTLAVFLAAIAVQSQDKKQTRSADDDDIIKVTSNLVSLDVIVKDKKGKAVTDLNREDFTVTENGVAQKIEFFDSTLTTTNNNEATQTATSTVPTETRSRIPTGFPRN